MSMTELLRGAMKRREPKKEPVLDSVTDPNESASQYTMQDIALKSAAAVQQWAETDDLDDGESHADRLMALMIGVADANQDGDITEDEQYVLDIVLNSTWDYLVSKGVADEDAGSLLNDWDADAAERVRDLITSVLPDGEDESYADIANFAFSDADQEPALDAAYRKTMVVRGGKKMRINKRVSGTVYRSSKQKLATRKAMMKSHSATAQAHRARSMRMRQKVGL